VAATPDPRVIFIILIITLNLHDPSLSVSDCHTRLNSLRLIEKKKNQKEEKN